jgi:hypothetical protein
MSVAVGWDGKTCSGAAFQASDALWPGDRQGVRQAFRANGFAMPKSNNLGAPSAVTKMLEGLMSRCTTRLRCAYCTAAYLHEQFEPFPNERVRLSQ